MGRRKSQRSRVLDVVITASLSLFLFFVVLAASGGLPGARPMGSFGDLLAQAELAGRDLVPAGSLDGRLVATTNHFNQSPGFRL